jgi:O-antigen ligase
MKQLSARSIKLALAIGVVAPLWISIAWSRIVVPCDFIAQASLILLMFTLPFCTSLQRGFGKPLALLFAVGFVWGIWRGFYFDPITDNDVPGIGYVIAAVMMGAVSAFIFLIRGWVIGRTSRTISS